MLALTICQPFAELIARGNGRNPGAVGTREQIRDGG